jgi:hypothetical protein
VLGVGAAPASSVTSFGGTATRRRRRPSRRPPPSGATGPEDVLIAITDEPVVDRDVRYGFVIDTAAFQRTVAPRDRT